MVVISGFRSDATAEQIARKASRGTGNSGAYQLMVDLEESGCSAMFFNWNGTSAGQFASQKGAGAEGIVRSIRRANIQPGFEQLVLVGHSWGGHTLLDVADLLKRDPTIDVDLAIGLDASSFSRGERMESLPTNIAKLINYFSDNAFTWGEWPDELRVRNISLADPANGFVVDGKPDYASKLSWEAHNAAEWDANVHAAIKKLVLDLATAAETTNHRMHGSGGGRRSLESKSTPATP
ncbi:hypothetical protein LF1_51770 [Rubripirellula obstinata]|uniref:Alpha/beta hydrolase family protein n=3 Tax=Rubripirellula obstinata TaxID=406547 RepID=A0A5B1CSE3_9BACT|nr:hypothetical protein LF1_51770 [Rubripirellula obstinata]